MNILPNIKSAKKRVELTDDRTKKNNALKTSLKTSLKKFETSLTTNDSEKINEAYINAVSAVDKAASKGIIKKNSANNKKASLGKKLDSAK